jgi:hypothetical protein
MTSDLDPPRLADGGAGAPVELCDLLAGARRDVPTAGELERLAAGLPLLAPIATAPAPAAASGVLGKSLASLVVAGVLVGGGVWLSRAPEPPPAHQAAPAPRTAPPAAAPTAQSVTPPADSARAAPEPPARVGPNEATLLRQAQASLRNDPARALSLTREHRRRFPRGVLAQEREVIAIEALSRLGRPDEAKKAATDFTELYPDSAHRKKVETTTGGARSP